MPPTQVPMELWRHSSQMASVLVKANSVPLEDLVAESQRVLDAAKRSDVILRLTGGLAIRRICRSTATPPLRREYADLDLAVTTQSGHRRALTNLMLSLGYEPEEQFNALHGSSRLHFNAVTSGHHVDVFVDAVRMCHVIDFRQRLHLLQETLTPTDLLLTKLQIVRLNEKDVKDAIALLHDVRLAAGTDDAIDVTYLEQVWGADWSLWRTSQLTLTHLRAAAPSLLDEAPTERVRGVIAQLEQILAVGRKSFRWKVRSQVGDRIRWYDEPEDVK